MYEGEIREERQLIEKGLTKMTTGEYSLLEDGYTLAIFKPQNDHYVCTYSFWTKKERELKKWMNSR